MELTCIGTIPPSKKWNQNLQAFKFPLTAKMAIDWMYSIVSAITDKHKIEKSKRGVKILQYGNMDYDIIPSFLLQEPLERNQYFHLIPKETYGNRIQPLWTCNFFENLETTLLAILKKRFWAFESIVARDLAGKKHMESAVLFSVLPLLRSLKDNHHHGSIKKPLKKWWNN
mmetsp:Transcript_29261/g.41190  ORF Transcript_29261/g.41190 Transcript_29261/m.41190 type:complete len:171 (+) Transcript_29261:21-533(+)